MPESLSFVGEQKTHREGRLPSCAVLVMSSDGYRDLWRPFFTLFWRYWPDCPFPVYLGSNRIPYEDDTRISTLLTGDFEWGKTLRLWLEQIDSEYVLVLLEDYFLRESVPTARVLDALATIDALHGVVLRLYPHPGPDAAISGHARIGRIHRLAPFRVSTQPAIWHRAELLSLARDDESIWDFEVEGTRRSRSRSAGFYATYRPVLRYRHVVDRGKWFRSALRHYGKEPIGCDFAARPLMGRLRTVVRFLNGHRRNMVDVIARLRFRGRA